MSKRQYPNNEQLEDVLAKAIEGQDAGSKWPGMSYEDGVEATIRWIMGDADDPMEE